MLLKVIPWRYNIKLILLNTNTKLLKYYISMVMIIIFIKKSFNIIYYTITKFAGLYYPKPLLSILSLRARLSTKNQLNSQIYLVPINISDWKLQILHCGDKLRFCTSVNHIDITFGRPDFRIHILNLWL